MHHAEEHFAGFVVFVFEVFFDHVAQRFVSRLIALHDIAHAFVDDDEVVVFVEDLEVLFGGNYFQGYRLWDNFWFFHFCHSDVGGISAKFIEIPPTSE